jgi:Zn-finger nucleic acid-binding protein
MLIACSRCHRQYDVGHLAVGERVRCACGHVNPVPAPRARRVAMLHCSSCGGRLREGAATCDYCSAEVCLADRGLGPACPECLAGTFADAKHCAGCGVRIAPEAVLRALADRHCPRCRQPLTESEDEGRRYVECTRCGGLWLDETLFERIASEKERALPVAIRGPVPAAGQPQGREDVRYLPCPVCSQIMSRRNFAGCSGVVLDWCRGHGWWFDAAELERVLAFLEQGGWSARAASSTSSS